MEMESVLCVTTGKVDEVCWLAPIIFLMMEKNPKPIHPFTTPPTRSIPIETLEWDQNLGGG
jgi:hypothetical protein